MALKKCSTRVYDVLLDEVSDMIEEEQNRKKRLWVRDWIGRRDSQEGHLHFFSRNLQPRILTSTKFETLPLPTDAHNVKKHRVIKTF